VDRVPSRQNPACVVCAVRGLDKRGHGGVAEGSSGPAVLLGAVERADQAVKTGTFQHPCMIHTTYRVGRKPTRRTKKHKRRRWGLRFPPRNCDVPPFPRIYIGLGNTQRTIVAQYPGSPPAGATPHQPTLLPNLTRGPHERPQLRFAQQLRPCAGAPQRNHRVRKPRILIADTRARVAQ
jgi:hypothetical protein